MLFSRYWCSFKLFCGNGTNGVKDADFFHDFSSSSRAYISYFNYYLGTFQIDFFLSRYLHFIYLHAYKSTDFFFFYVDNEHLFLKLLSSLSTLLNRPKKRLWPLWLCSSVVVDEVDL